MRIAVPLVMAVGLASAGCGASYEAARSSHDGVSASSEGAVAAYPEAAAMPSVASEGNHDYAPSVPQSAGNAFGAPPPPPPPPPPMAPSPAEPGAATQTVSNKQHLVYTATFHMAVYQVEQGLDRAEAVANELGGYLSSRSNDQIVFRVPKEKFNEAVARITETGDVISREIKALDVTDEFVDLQSRLQSAKVLRQRYETLLAKAEVKEAIEIEKELGRIGEQIEVLEGKLKLLSDRIAFSTLTVSYASKGQGSGQTHIRLPFSWVHRLGVRRLLDFYTSDRGR